MKKKYLEPLMKVQSIDLSSMIAQSIGIDDSQSAETFDVKENTLEW